MAGPTSRRTRSTAQYQVFAEIEAKLCTPALEPGCIRPPPAAKGGRGLRSRTSESLPYSLQTSIGFQRQLGPVMAVEVDYVSERRQERQVAAGQCQPAYNPDTGVNYPWTDVSRRPFPLHGPVSMTPFTGWSRYHGLQTALTKRLSNRWQGSVTYTLAGLSNADPQAAQRPARSPVRRGAGPRRRVHARRVRPAPSRGVQRPLAAGSVASR